MGLVKWQISVMRVEYGTGEFIEGVGDFAKVMPYFLNLFTEGVR